MEKINYIIIFWDYLVLLRIIKNESFVCFIVDILLCIFVLVLRKSNLEKK